MQKLIKSIKSNFDKSWGQEWECNAKHGQSIMKALTSNALRLQLSFPLVWMCL